MFRKLRNKLILINLGITGFVIVVVFAAIYIIYMRAADARPPIPENMRGYSTEVESFIEDRIQAEKDTAAGELLVILVVSGVAIELAVALGSYYLAEEAIKPIREAYDAQKVFIANASHEIKTPLAAIAANLEAADIQNNKWIENVEYETAKLTTLNSELLELARTDLVTDTQLAEINLEEIVKKATGSIEPRMDKKKFAQNIKANGKIKINAADWERILSILLDNAVKYSDRKISLVVDSHELVVKNDGKAIKEEDLPHIFERFYQVDKSAEGVGLGLAIAKALADRNGWNLSAKSNNSTTEFTLKY